MQMLDVFFAVSLNDLLKKQSSCRCLETPWRWHDIILIHPHVRIIWVPCSLNWCLVILMKFHRNCVFLRGMLSLDQCWVIDRSLTRPTINSKTENVLDAEQYSKMGIVTLDIYAVNCIEEMYNGILLRIIFHIYVYKIVQTWKGIIIRRKVPFM